MRYGHINISPCKLGAFFTSGKKQKERQWRARPLCLIWWPNDFFSVRYGQISIPLANVDHFLHTKKPKRTAMASVLTVFNLGGQRFFLRKIWLKKCFVFDSCVLYTPCLQKKSVMCVVCIFFLFFFSRSFCFHPLFVFFLSLFLFPPAFFFLRNKFLPFGVRPFFTMRKKQKERQWPPY